MTAVVEDASSTDEEQTIETTKPEPQSPTDASESITKPSYDTSQEAQLKSVKPDVRDDSTDAKQIKRALEEPVLTEKVPEMPPPVISEETTPAPSRRKSKASTTDTQPAQNKLEETDQIANINPDVSETDAEKPVSVPKIGELKSSQVFEISETVITQDVTTKYSAEGKSSSIAQVITGTATVEESKLLPNKRMSKSLKMSPQLSHKEETKTMEKSASQISLRSIEQTEVAVVQETKIIPTRKKSKSLHVSTAPEPELETDRSKCAIKEPEKSLSTEFFSGPPEIVVPEQSDILPPKRKSKSPNFAFPNGPTREIACQHPFGRIN